MPLYEYHCRSCQNTFEKLQKQPSENLACPNCGHTAKRSVSVFAGASQHSESGCARPGGSGFG